MKTKNFYLCLLLLVLGTANVWADKYYQPWDYRHEDPRFRNLSQMVGEKFMIYNTSFSGGTDLTGFLYDNGAGFLLDKTKERDRFVYNERFVYVLEEYGTANDGAYAIRSITDGSYVGTDGSTTHSTPQPIYIMDWDAAGAAGWARADVRCENEDFAGVDNGSITTASCQVFLLSNTATHTADSQYWNGDNNTFGVTSNGQPFAFYRVHEVQSGTYLEDLHIFSRSDVYSAQVIWGYVQDAGQITTSDGISTTTSLLIDGDFTTGTSTDYLRFDLGKAVSSIYVYLQRSSADGDVVPASVKIEASANGNDGWVNITEYATRFASNISSTNLINLNASYRYIRISNVATGEQIALSEAYILPNNDKTTQAFDYFTLLANLENPVYRRASEQQYTSLVEQYNDNFPEVKTLSGVPLPGNKYRIYADAYDVETATYVNKEICLDNDAVVITPNGSYNDLKVSGDTDGMKKYEWYCEKTNDGYLVFRNVSNPAIYLANNGQASETVYKWSMSTVQTSRFGVPLWDGQGRYLTIANDGSKFIPDVTSAQDQTATAGYTYQIAGADTPDDESDDVAETIESGICTDFVFIPVDIISTEKKITFTANEITKRNSVFKIGEEVYTLPYSRMFTSKAELDNVTFTLQCPDIHSYAGTYVNNSENFDDTGKVGHEDGVLTFDYDAINDGDVLDIKLEFTPFETCNDGSSLYLVRSVRNQSIAQQAPGMRRAGDSSIEIGGDENDGPISTAGANVYYAKFVGRNKRMSLTPASKYAAESAVTTTFGATSLFYFQETEDNKKTDEYYSVSIRSAITPFMCESTASWSRTGDTWYVQPNVASGLVGYAIGLNVLNATNNPGDAWCTNHTDGDSIVSYYAEDAGAVWEFIKVDPTDAKTLLKNYIAEKADAVKIYINSKMNSTGIDNNKANKYIAYIDGIVGNSTNASITVAQLVDLSQKVHMLEHEVEFALQQLPDVTHREDIGEAKDYDFPHWYYIYNVRSKYAADGTTEQNEYYAKYVGPNTRMALEQVTDADGDGNKDFSLEHMFYFEGRAVLDSIGEGTFNLITDNELSIDDHLQVDIHNFVAPDTTLVSKNKLVIDPKENFFPGSGEQTIVDGISLEYQDSWRIECEYDFTGDKFESFNTFGSCLLSSTSPGLTSYENEFQVYLQDDRDIVVKLNNATDANIWDGTRDYYTNIKIVITHSPMSTVFDIYNSKGDKKTFTFTRAQLNTVTELTTMLPANGVKIKVIGIEEIEAYDWKKQDLSAGDPTTVDTKDEEDTWYILPSSNTKYQGFSIVAKGANDNNLGWTNVTASNKEIFSDAGNADNSTWQFVRIKEFDDLVDELLAKYNASDCVIYNEKLAALFRLLSKNASYIKKVTYDNPIEIDGVEKTDEDFFNEIYEAIKNYDGPMPDELKRPKPGKFYTIRPAYGNSDVRVAVNDWNSLVQREGLIEVVDDKKHYDSHSVWFFDGTADGEYLKRDENLTLNSLHTQSNTKDFTAEKYMLDDDATAENIVLLPVGGCIVRLNDGSVNLRHKAIGDTALVGNSEDLSYGYVNTTFNRTGTDDASVTSTAFNEFSELVLSDDEVNTPFTVSVASNYDYVSSGNNVTDEILCPDVNGNGDNNGSGENINGKPIEFEFTYTNLPSSFTSFNNIGLHIHALNSGKSYQSSTDGVVRQWNIAVSVSTNGGTSYTDFGSLTDIDIANGITGSNKVWNIVKTGDDFTIAGSLKVKFTIAKGTTNNGCFFGLSNVILSAEGDTWYIEEMPDADKVNIFHETKTNSNIGLGSLMLGYTAKIPTGISAFYPATNQDLTDRHITFRSYGEPSDPVRLLPACTPAILKIADGADKSATYRFYYDANEVDDAADKATEDEKIIIEGSLYKKYVHVANTYGNRFGDGYSSNVYMYLSSSTTPKLTWVWYNYTAEGVNTGNNNTGGHVNVNANRAYIVMGKAVAKNIGSFSMRFDGGWTTDIEDIEDDYSQEEANEGAEGIFDLQGRKLDEITAPGIYIVNGEKVLVK